MYTTETQREKSHQVIEWMLRLIGIKVKDRFYGRSNRGEFHFRPDLRRALYTFVCYFLQ